MTAPSPEFLNGIADIVMRYDALILDVWGVLHNGVEPYPHVVETLRRLSEAGKEIALLSNAPMRAETVAARVVNIGVPRNLFGRVMSSGEQVWQHLRDRHVASADAFYAALGDRCLWLGPGRHSGMCEGLGLTLVKSPSEADFILNTGPDDLDDEATALRPILDASIAAGLPMVCANADLHVVHGGTQIVCAGRVAQIYEQLGGTVSWHGKPFPSIYQACLGLLDGIDPTRILAVGDSLRTDIQGAANAGLDSLLVTGGIHAELFGHDQGALDRSRILGALADGPLPRYVAAGLIW